LVKGSMVIQSCLLPHETATALTKVHRFLSVRLELD
jgi:hypothetical protein